jgi:hypothetical protein
MATVKVKAIQPHTYKGKEYKVDEVYDIDEEHAATVQVQGKAVLAEKKDYSTRDLTAKK